MTTTLDLTNKNLTELPTDLPATLQELYCYHNKLTELPTDLPATLQTLYCSDNDELTELPDLPATLQTLYCSNNKLTELPDLPATLQTLYCSDNELTELPDLPATLRVLICSNNPQLDITYPLLNQVQTIQLDITYPLLDQLINTTTLEAIAYVNEINSSRRIHKRTALLKSQIMEKYAIKTMHPKNLQPLLDDPDKDVDEFMREYVDAL